MNGRWCDGCLMKPIVGWGPSLSCSKCYNAFSDLIGTGYDLVRKLCDDYMPLNGGLLILLVCKVCG